MSRARGGGGTPPRSVYGSRQSTGCGALLREQVVGPAEGPGAEEAAVRRHRGRVGGLDRPGSRPGSGRRLRASRPHRIDTSGLPRAASARMACSVTSSQPLPRWAAGLAGRGRQRPVEQQHALPRPGRQVAVGRAGAARGRVCSSRKMFSRLPGRSADVRGHREAQPDRHARGRVGVLTDDQDAYVVEGLLEGAQDVRPGRQIGAAGARSPRGGSPPSPRCVRPRVRGPSPSRPPQVHAKVVVPQGVTLPALRPVTPHRAVATRTRTARSALPFVLVADLPAGPRQRERNPLRPVEHRHAHSRPASASAHRPGGRDDGRRRGSRLATPLRSCPRGGLRRLGAARGARSGGRARGRGDGHGHEPVRTGRGGIDAGHFMEQLLPLVTGVCGEPAPGGDRRWPSRVGAAGMATLGDDAARRAARRAGGGVRRTGPLALAADAVTAYAGALGPRPGAVVAAGTGMIALGTDLTRVAPGGRLGPSAGRLRGRRLDRPGGPGGGAAGARRAARRVRGAAGRGRGAVRADAAGCPAGSTRAPTGPPCWPPSRRRWPRCARERPGRRRASCATAARHIAESAAAVCPAGTASRGSRCTGGLFRMGDPLLVPLGEELARRLPHARLVPAGGRSAATAPCASPAALATGARTCRVDGRLLSVLDGRGVRRTGQARTCRTRPGGGLPACEVHSQPDNSA